MRLSRTNFSLSKLRLVNSEGIEVQGRSDKLKFVGQRSRIDDTLGRTFNNGARMLLKHPGVTVVAVLTLAWALVQTRQSSERRKR